LGRNSRPACQYSKTPSKKINLEPDYCRGLEVWLKRKYEDLSSNPIQPKKEGLILALRRLRHENFKKASLCYIVTSRLA
jgi:hypothetical protein